jgi:BTB/POZ domain/PH domain
VRRNWKERWFALRGNILKYYDRPLSKGKVMELGEIPLHKGSVAIDSSTKKDMMFTIQAVMADGEKKNFLVKARTEQEMREWIEAIGQGGKVAPPPNASGAGESGYHSGADEDDDDECSSSSGSFAAASSAADGGGGGHVGDGDDDSAAAGAMDEPPASARGEGGDLYRLKFNYFGALSHRNMLLEPKLANVHFAYPSGGIVYAHDFVLEVRSPTLARLVGQYRKKRKLVTVVDMRAEKTKIGPATLGLVLSYLYGDALPTSIDVVDAVRLLKAAEQFKLTRLIAIAKNLLLQQIGVANAYAILKEAHTVPVEWAKRFALDFVHQNIKTLIKQKEEGKKLGIDLFQEVVTLTTEDYDEAAPGRAEFAPAEVPPTTYVADFKTLYDATQEGSTGDSVVKSSLQAVGFHRAVLSAHSKGFAELFNVDNRPGEDVTSVLGAKSLSPDAFRALLKFVYYGDDNVPTTVACEIANFAERLYMHDFQTLCERTLDDSMSTSNVVTVLQTTYVRANRGRKEMAALRDKALSFIVDNVADVDLSALRKGATNDDALEIAADLIDRWQQSARNAKSKRIEERRRTLDAQSAAPVARAATSSSSSSADDDAIGALAAMANETAAARAYSQPLPPAPSSGKAKRRPVPPPVVSLPQAVVPPPSAATLPPPLSPTTPN